MKTTKIAAAALALTLAFGAALPAFSANAQEYEEDTSTAFNTSSDDGTEPLDESSETETSPDDDASSDETSPEESDADSDTSSEEEDSSAEDSSDAEDSSSDSDDSSSTGDNVDVQIDAAAYGLTKLTSLNDLSNVAPVTSAEADAFLNAYKGIMSDEFNRLTVIMSYNVENATAHIRWYSPDEDTIVEEEQSLSVFEEVMSDTANYKIYFRPAQTTASSVTDSSSVADTSSVTESTTGETSSVENNSVESTASDTSSAASAADSTSSTASSSVASASSNAVAKTGEGAAAPAAAVLGTTAVLTGALVLTAKKRKSGK